MDRFGKTILTLATLVLAVIAWEFHELNRSFQSIQVQGTRADSTEIRSVRVMTSVDGQVYVEAEVYNH